MMQHHATARATPLEPLPILHDTQVDADIRVLDDAWAHPATFAFVPHKSGIGGEWIVAALAALPSELRTGHFALLTSGSTGQPKLVIGKKQRSEALARVLHERQESEPVRRTIVTLPLTYCYAFVNQWLWSRVTGRELVLTRGFSSPDTLLRALTEADDAMLCMVGAQVPLLVQTIGASATGGGRAAFPGVVRLHFAGGRFPQDKLEILRGFFPNARIYNNYGCAEAMPRLTLRPAETVSLGANIGFPLPGVELRVDERDALLFRSPYGCVGYVDGEGFHQVDEGDWVPTGDLARPSENLTGAWELLGRANEVFKRYGEKISLSMLHATISAVWSGQQAFYRETDSTGEAAHVLVLAPAPTADELHAVLQALRRSYSRVHWPVRVESIGDLPRLPNGKIDLIGLSQLSDGDRAIHWRQRLA
jgi:acyl-CoA synthetase (AMP-forming)/AMP-acid ligase II